MHANILYNLLETNGLLADQEQTTTQARNRPKDTKVSRRIFKSCSKPLVNPRPYGVPCCLFTALALTYMTFYLISITSILVLLRITYLGWLVSLTIWTAFHRQMSAWNQLSPSSWCEFERGEMPHYHNTTHPESSFLSNITIPHAQSETPNASTYAWCTFPYVISM
jgi:hypothetical protein